MKRASRLLAMGLACGLFTMTSLPGLAEQTFYRWVDDRGDTVHSDRPPPKGVKYEVISTQSRFVRQVDGEAGAVPPQVEPTVSNNFNAVDTNQTLVEKNPEFCQRAKDNLEALNTDVQIQMRDKNGELRAITNEEREIQKKKAMDTMAVHCE